MHNQWFDFFFGTPKQALVTAATLVLLGMVVNPAFRVEILNSVASILVAVLQLAIMAGITVAIWRALTSNKMS